MSSTFAAQTVATGLSTETEVTEVSAGWRWWGEQPDAWFVVVHGELLAEVRSCT